MMKKLLLVFLLFAAVSAKAQLNNSWIDCSTSYYKGFLSQESLCRIPQSTLAAGRLSGVNADHFQLWKNGEQVRLYTSVTNSGLSAADFIEFWGEMNDGNPDNTLYRNADF